MRARPSILIAEDDAGIRDILRTRLQQTGYETLMARNGAEALHRILAHSPDGVVLDINMPEMNGFEVLEQLRAARRLARTPVLVLTARHAAEDVRRAVGLGAKDYLTKPFSESQLLARVARLLRPPIPAPPANQIIL